MQVKEFSFQSTLKTQVHLRQGDKDKPVVVLLHGYGQRGEDILLSLESCFPASWTLVAPNAPYPFYNSKQKKMVYSWYFFDVENQLFVVDRQAARSMMAQLLPEVLNSGSKWFVLGFSQGAYMAPFVTDLYSEPALVVALNGRLRHEDLLAWPFKFPIIALHGAQDELVDVEKSKTSSELLKSEGWDIQFKTFSTSGHSLDKALTDEVAHIFIQHG